MAIGLDGATIATGCKLVKSTSKQPRFRGNTANVPRATALSCLGRGHQWELKVKPALLAERL
jgi:hypothetical protein